MRKTPEYSPGEKTYANELEGFKVGQFIDVPGLSKRWVINKINCKTRMITLVNPDPKYNESKLHYHEVHIDALKLWPKHKGSLPAKYR